MLILNVKLSFNPIYPYAYKKECKSTLIKLNPLELYSDEKDANPSWWRRNNDGTIFSVTADRKANKDTRLKVATNSKNVHCVSYLVSSLPTQSSANKRESALIQLIGYISFVALRAEKRI